MIASILASTKDGLIGDGDKLPWSIPQELQFFKKTTTGNTIVMGRKTADTLPCALPKRVSIAVTRSEYNRSGYAFVNSVDEAVEFSKKTFPEKDIFIIGGAEIYKASEDIIDVLYWSEITLDNVKGDTYYHIDFSKWSKKEMIDSGDGYICWKLTR